VTCAKGCGACCRQIVPVSQAEARALGRLVAAMPEARRDHVRQRFRDALAALEVQGLLAEVDAARATPGASARDLGLRYFKAGVACPFLEDEACSIHPERPLACRQYLVTSPPAQCADPVPGSIVPVPVPSRPSTALLLADTAESGVPWLPLVYALIYHDEVPETPPQRTAPAILQDIFGRLKRPQPPEAG
jgi:Fe-S-cluster containining protein